MNLDFKKVKKAIRKIDKEDMQLIGAHLLGLDERIHELLKQEASREGGQVGPKEDKG